MLLSINKKNKVYPFLLLTFPVIIDCLNGLLRGGDGGGDSIIGIVFRGCVMLYSFNYIFNYKYYKYTFLIFYILLFSIVYQLLNSYSDFSIFLSASKNFFLYFILAILLKSKSFYDKYYVVSCAIAYGVAASLVLIYCFIFKIGYSTYTDSSFGTKGFFIAMNDVGLSLILLNGLSLLFYQKTNNIKYLICSIIIFIGSSLAGSMACYAGSFILFICYLISQFMKFEDYSPKLKNKALIIMGGIFASFYAVRSIFTIIQNDDYLVTKYDNVLTLFTEMSGRDYLIEAAFKSFEKFTSLDWLLGEGTFFSVRIQHLLGVGAPKGVEVDPIDLVGTYGLLFSLLVFCFPIWHLLRAIKYFIKNRSVTFYWGIIGIVIFLGHSIYGGHAYTSPLVSSFLAVYIYVLLNVQKDKV